MHCSSTNDNNHLGVSSFLKNFFTLAFVVCILEGRGSACGLGICSHFPMPWLAKSLLWSSCWTLVDLESRSLCSSRSETCWLSLASSPISCCWLLYQQFVSSNSFWMMSFDSVTSYNRHSKARMVSSFLDISSLSELVTMSSGGGWWTWPPLWVIYGCSTWFLYKSKLISWT